MTDREKIINIVEQNKLCIVDVDCKDCQYKDKLDKTFTCGSYKLADLLIAANIGDVTEWKEQVECAKRILQIPTLPDGKTDLSYFEYKGERIQDIARQRDEYKHRAEVAERALATVCEEVLHARYPVEYVTVSVVNDFIQHILKEAEKELAED